MVWGVRNAAGDDGSKVCVGGAGPGDDGVCVVKGWWEPARRVDVGNREIQETNSHSPHHHTHSTRTCAVDGRRGWAWGCGKS